MYEEESEIFGNYEWINEEEVPLQTRILDSLYTSVKESTEVKFCLFIILSVVNRLLISCAW